MNYTPGPWKIDGGTNRHLDLFVWTEGEYFGPGCVATVHGNIQEGAEGNACLIAAAPELLEALEEAIGAIDFSLDYLPDPDHGTFYKAVVNTLQKARAAVSKAIGEKIK